MVTFTLLEPDAVHEVAGAMVDGRIVLDAAALEHATGWSRRPEGLCHGDVCIPVRPDAVLDSPVAGAGAGIDLAGFADALRRPLAVELTRHVAFLGESAATRARELESLVAPDFTLPGLDGTSVSLSSLRGKKVFLVAWASW